MDKQISDKDILYQFLSREIDNFITMYFPVAHIFSSQIKNYLFNFLDPYIDLFYMGGERINTNAVREFSTQEVSNKINDFLTKFENERKS